jgi:hypothetical protein
VIHLDLRPFKTRAHLSMIFSVLIALIAGVFSSTASADIFIYPWYDGVLTSPIGTDTACNTTITETRVSAYSGITYYPPLQTVSIPFAQFPAPGEIFYAKLVVAHPGNPCFGSAVGIEILLPAGVTTAMSADFPLFCFSILPPNSQHSDYKLDNLAGDVGYGCPQTLTQGVQGLAIYAPHGGAGGGSWGMAAGFWLEFMVPLRASAPQNGSNQIYFRVNPDIGVVGYAGVPLIVNADTIFRTPNEDQNLSLDICGVATTITGC